MFGGIEGAGVNPKMFFVLVNRRNKATLLHCIKKYIAPGMCQFCDVLVDLSLQGQLLYLIVGELMTLYPVWDLITVTRRLIIHVSSRMQKVIIPIELKGASLFMYYFLLLS